MYERSCTVHTLNGLNILTSVAFISQLCFKEMSVRIVVVFVNCGSLDIARQNPIWSPVRVRAYVYVCMYVHTLVWLFLSE